MLKFWRQSRTTMIILTFLRVYIGIQWIQNAMNKLLNGFDSSGMINGALNGSSSYPWFQDFLHLTTGGGENVTFFNILVPWAQLAIGLGLIFGTFTLAAAFFGLLMNTTFILSGVVSENPTYIVIQLLILLGGFNAAKIGLDYWITPFLREKIPFLHNDIATPQRGPIYTSTAKK